MSDYLWVTQAPQIAKNGKKKYVAHIYEKLVVIFPLLYICLL